MRTLAEFLFERQYVSPINLPDSTLAEAVEAIAMAEYDNQAYIEVKKQVEEMYGKKVFNALVGYVEFSFEAGVPFDVIKDAIYHTPLDRIPKILGSGSVGAAFDIGDGKVVKWYHRGHEMSAKEYQFYEICMKHPFRHLPTIYRLSKYFVVMQKLEMHTPKCKLYNNTYERYMGWKDGKNPKSIENTVMKWYNDTDAYLRKYGSCISDFGINNIGEDPKTHDIIMFDPVAG